MACFAVVVLKYSSALSFALVHYEYFLRALVDIVLLLSFVDMHSGGQVHVQLKDGIHIREGGNMVQVEKDIVLGGDTLPTGTHFQISLSSRCGH